MQNKLSDIIGRKVFGPFPKSPIGATQGWKIDKVARLYQFNRLVRNMGASDAMQRALPYAYGDSTVSQWYGKRGAMGASSQLGSDIVRWTESTADIGLRFLGYSDELAGRRVDHFGWFTDEHQETSLRGAVWLLPGRKGASRYLHGYVEMEGRKHEMNPGSARLVVSEYASADMSDSDSCFEGAENTDAAIDSATWGDSVAESAADKEREYNEGYNMGRQAAELDSEAIETRRELLPLLAELRLERRDKETTRPAICAALRGNVDSLLETISSAREKRDSLWSDCHSWMESAFVDGFRDNGGVDQWARFAKALGYTA